MVEPALPVFTQVQDPLGVLLFPPRKIGAKKTGPPVPTDDPLWKERTCA